ncbi:MAG: UDP-N-acetylmuramate dehydrogenase [Candidatus Zixiibacteriota bacterium]
MTSPDHQITGTSSPPWARPLGGRLQADVPLGPLTTLKIGGPAEWYFAAQTRDDLVAALRLARGADIPLTLLGDGSNVLISDRGVRGLVVHNRAGRIERRGDDIYCESGALLADLVERSGDEGLTGMEFATGIYGTVGGAVFGNAGAYGKSMADILAWVEVLTTEGELVRIVPAGMEFSYRRSGCSAHGWIVVACQVQLAQGDRGAIAAEIARILSLRATKLPKDLPSAGSYFKNIEDPTAEFGKIPAGRLLEAVGAKALRVGDAAVYEHHANVIVNLGHARAADVLALADSMKRRVKERYGIELDNEVRFVGIPHD